MIPSDFRNIPPRAIQVVRDHLPPTRQARPPSPQEMQRLGELMPYAANGSLPWTPPLSDAVARYLDGVWHDMRQRPPENLPPPEP